MSEDDLIDLWAEANRHAGIRHSHAFINLKIFAELILDKQRARFIEMLRNPLLTKAIIESALTSGDITYE
jgi:hypothetical protein